jgi:hypothetical protein
MTGNEVPQDWKGTIPNITYKLGGKLTHSSWYVPFDSTSFLINDQYMNGNAKIFV